MNKLHKKKKGWIGLLPNHSDQRLRRMHNLKEAISDLIPYFKKWIRIRKICHLTTTVQGKFGIRKIRSYTSFERSSTWSCKQVILDVPSLLNKKDNDIVNIHIMRWNDLQFMCNFAERNYKPCSLILILRYIETEIRGVIVPTDKACIYIYIFLIR